MVERHAKILDILNEYKRVEVNRLSELMGVSQVTIRKDLQSLEERGLLMREHGYAVIGNTDDINTRLAFKYAIKMSIAEKAAELVSDGETIMIESGSTCALLADCLVKTKKDITIITNSAFIATFINEKDAGKVILLGGDYQKKSQVLVGPILKVCVKGLHVDKLFVGTDGFATNVGFTGSNMMRIDAVKAMAESASNIIVLTDSSKFGQQGVVSQFTVDEVFAVYTDNGIPKDAKDILESNGVRLGIVE